MFGNCTILVHFVILISLIVFKIMDLNVSNLTLFLECNLLLFMITQVPAALNNTGTDSITHRPSYRKRF